MLTTFQIAEADSDSDKRSSQDRRKFSKGCRRSRSNPQLRPRQVMAELMLDSRQPTPSSRHSPSFYRASHQFPERDIAVNTENYRPPLPSTDALNSGNVYAKAAPLVQRSPDSRSFLRSYFVPLSDHLSSNRPWMGQSGMIKSKSLDKLDEIMRNDPILRDDYYSAVPASKSAQTQTDEAYTKKKTRRKRNDRPRSQILPPTYLQLPSVTWLPGELSDTHSKRLVSPSNAHEVQNCSPQKTHGRKSREEQAQIIQRWIDEMIEHKKAQELQKQAGNPMVGREKSAKLKKKSRSVPEHAFRGNSAKSERRRASGDSSDLQREEQIKTRGARSNSTTSAPKLRHSGSDPTIKSAQSRMTGHNKFSGSTVSVSTSPKQSASVVDEKISPSLQSRIRSLEQSFQQNNQSVSSSQDNSNDFEMVRSLKRPVNDFSTTNEQIKRTRASNPDLPLISHLLSENELDSRC